MFQQRTPQWIAVGGVLLTAIAGQVNAIGVLGAFHQALTHVTGTVTHSAIAVAGGEVGVAVNAASIVVAFVAGAAVAGAIVGSAEVKRGRPYSVALIVEAALLALAGLLLSRGQLIGEQCAALAAGLQNGLVTTWSGAVLRTSHVTGIATDIGLAIGLRLRGGERTGRLLLHTALLAGFFAGSVAGALLFRRFGWPAMAAPVGLCLLAAALYTSSTARAEKTA